MAGRPSKYKEEYAEQAYKLCLLGATDKDMADFFEVDESTINNWKLTHEEFLESIKKGKTIADADVAETLHKKAIGWNRAYKGKDNELKYEYYPPDTTAAIFWLKNRQPKLWREKQEIDLGNKDDKPFTVTLEGPLADWSE